MSMSKTFDVDAAKLAEAEKAAALIPEVEEQVRMMNKRILRLIT